MAPSRRILKIVKLIKRRMITTTRNCSENAPFISRYATVSRRCIAGCLGWNSARSVPADKVFHLNMTSFAGGELLAEMKTDMEEDVLLRVAILLLCHHF